MKVEFKGVHILQPAIYFDERGFLMEVYNKNSLRDIGISVDFPYSIISESKKDVIRGLHFQWEPPLGKFIQVLRGGVYFVAVDIRKRSATFGKWFGMNLNDQNNTQMYIEPGFAAGFAVLSNDTRIQYHYSVIYNPKGESNIAWNDPDIGIKWPILNPILSDRDKNAGSFKQWVGKKDSDKFL